jgi:hypothetical protein
MKNLSPWKQCSREGEGETGLQVVEVDDDCQGSDQNGQVLSQRRHKIGDDGVC